MGTYLHHNCVFQCSFQFLFQGVELRSDEFEKHNGLVLCSKLDYKMMYLEGEPLYHLPRGLVAEALCLCKY